MVQRAEPGRYVFGEVERELVVIRINAEAPRHDRPGEALVTHTTAAWEVPVAHLDPNALLLLLKRQVMDSVADEGPRLVGGRECP